jgi:hypothetical protein
VRVARRWLRVFRQPRQVVGGGTLIRYSELTLSPAQVVGGKRPHSSVAAQHESLLCLNLAVALPLVVWQDHLTPRLSVVEAARLRGVCKALRGVMDECPLKLGNVAPEVLRTALTCFPAAQSFELMIDDKLTAAEERQGVELLRRHGGALKRVVVKDQGAAQVFWSAVRAGALPKLNRCVACYCRTRPDGSCWRTAD